MKIQKALLIFVSLVISSSIFFSCSKKTEQVCAEDEFKKLGKSYEVCGRCGNISVNLENEKGDIILIHWDSPYVDYQNREGRITLKNKNVYKDGKTYVDSELFKILGLDIKE